ncbi:Hypothetical protein PMT_2523 [Prochlorococcus marinus str. MIT 9313]|uniref:Uncharacterized protein n=1 Tax=Prochlorococcus marinus (strain MIT 9313) TaxID=74547 RepID=B9ERU1_PROMM|nr:Hypothetical protein PMT_2523 [Prochlorococcus marinus str. MIT 9313]
MKRPSPLGSLGPPANFLQSFPSLPCVIHIGIHRSGFQQGELFLPLASFDHFDGAV